jgi:hypothetical protein
VPRRRRARLLPFLPALGLGVVLWANAGVRAQAPAPAPAPPPAEHAPAAGDGKQETITVGLYLQSLPEIDIKSNSFQAEFYLWFLWKGDLDPTLSYQLTNAINVAELSRTPIYTDAAGNAVAETLPDGRHLQTFHVYGRFGHPFPLSKYPFDDHDITISVEDAKNPIGRLTHQIDEKGSNMRPDLTIPGWTLSQMRPRLGRSQFATTFGDPRGGDTGETYSRVDFEVHIERPWVGIVVKTVIPIALIILITFGAFFCQPDDIDARLCLTITALISAVALQFTAATELPPTGSLLLLDKIYVMSYGAILAVTFCCIAANRAVHADDRARAARIDRWGLWLVGLGYFLPLAFFVLRER